MTPTPVLFIAFHSFSWLQACLAGLKTEVGHRAAEIPVDDSCTCTHAKELMLSFWG